MIEEETDKNIQTLHDHVNLSKIEEKRAKIKNRVVGELVGRLVAKFNRNKGIDIGKIEVLEKDSKKGVEITEINDNLVEPIIPTKSLVSPQKIIENQPVSKEKEKKEILPPDCDSESYFERGKLPKKDVKDGGLSRKKIEERLYEIFDSWDYDADNQTPVVKHDEKKVDVKTKNFSCGKLDYSKMELNPPKGDIIGINDSTKRYPGARQKTARFSSHEDRLSNQIKPLEMPKKLGKKYEDMLNKILDKHFGNADLMKHCLNQRITASNREPESLDKLRFQSEFDDLYKNDSNLPKIKLNNNWLQRGELHAWKTAEEDWPYLKKSKYSNKMTSYKKFSNNPRPPMESLTRKQMDEKLISDLKKEMELKYKKSQTNNGILDGVVSLRRPKPLLPSGLVSKRGLKASSCGDLPNSSKKNLQTSRPLKSGVENVKTESGFKSRGKFNNSNHPKQNKFKGNTCGILPPIESGELKI